MKRVPTSVTEVSRSQASPETFTLKPVLSGVKGKMVQKSKAPCSGQGVITGPMSFNMYLEKISLSLSQCVHLC